MDQAARQFNFPTAFEAIMRERLKLDFDRFALAHQRPAPVSIRVNPKKKITVAGTPIPWAKYGRYLPERPSFITDPMWHAGAYYVQEASSMFLEQAINTIGKQSISRALDLCAAPGGKSTHLLSLMQPGAMLIANEVIRSRASILAENIQRWGQPNTIVTNNDPSHFSGLENFFDLILVDAPCSGEGLFRKDPDAMIEWSQENVALCSARQNRILEDAWPALSRGGHLVYCTCTFNAAENENNLATFSNSHAVEFVELPLDISWGIEKIRHQGVIGYRFYPHQAEGEGFFLSVLKKTSGEPLVAVPKSRNRKTIPSALVKLSEGWLQPHPHLEIEVRDDTVVALVDTDLSIYLSQKLRIVTSGTAMATIKRNKLVPESALAFSTLLNPDSFPRINLPLPQAIQYLKKETVSLDTDVKGFALATYNNLGLGWMNLLPNRINNLYPSNWRILK